MTREDLDEVTEIDREAFPTQWPPADYAYEFKNHMAHYIVVCDSEVPAKPKPQRRDSGIGSWIRRLLGETPSSIQPGADAHYIVGFAGFWIMADEAHVTSIAVRKNYRGKGLGALLLSNVIDLAINARAEVVTLEVRLSNTSAQHLYLKYGFKSVGERKKYYLDRGPSGETREDAVIMTTDPILSPAYQELLRSLKERQIKS
jgi:ribosomal-protein-alanine N-acetyltransferase